jgi:hypothetical protein
MSDEGSGNVRDAQGPRKLGMTSSTVMARRYCYSIPDQAGAMPGSVEK